MDVRALGGLDLVGDVRSVPARTGSVDVVFALEVLEHLRQPTSLFLEAARVLADDGTAYISVPSTFPKHDENDYWRFTRQGLLELGRQFFEQTEVLVFGESFETLAVLLGYYTSLAAHRYLRPLVRIVPVMHRLGHWLDHRTSGMGAPNDVHSLATDLLLVASGPRRVSRQARAHPSRPPGSADEMSA